MKILKDSRQMPKEKEYIANKMYSDKVYAWLQVNSQWDRGADIRWIGKKDVVFTQIAKEVQLSRQTVATKFKALQGELGLIVYNEECQRYEINELPKNAATLVEKNTLRKMMVACNKNTINLYIYLLNRYLANNSQGYEFTLAQVKAALGLCTNTHSNDRVLHDIMDILVDLGLLQYDTFQKNANARVCRVITMSNKIKGC